METVRRELRKKGLFGRARHRKPLLSKRHKKLRRIWAEEHIGWKFKQWKKMWWSDEKKVSLVGSDGRRWCRRRKGEEYLERNVAKTVKHGGGKLNVWGVISWEGVGRIHRIEGNLTARKFTDILDESLLGSYHDASVNKSDIIFQ